MIYDLIIIGAGPAGITASVYAARKRMKFLVITKDIGGQAARSGDIENYTGYQFITGADLTAKFEEHMKKYGVETKEPEEVTGLSAIGGSALGGKKTNNGISVKTNKNTYEAKTVIIASGKKSRELGVPGEAEFKNRGLTYCATCDGPLFAGKDVVVIGGGNSALDAALQLIKIAGRIYIINITPLLTGDKIMQDKAEKSDKVTILNNTRILAILGDKIVNAVKIKEGGKEKTLAAQGVFVEIGLVPNSDFAEGVGKNDKGEIEVDRYNATNISGVFACGDVTDVPQKQIIIAAGEGSKAAISAFRFLAQQK